VVLPDVGDQAVKCSYSSFTAAGAVIPWESYQVLGLNVGDNRCPLPARMTAFKTPVEAHIQVSPLFNLGHPLLSRQARSITLSVSGLILRRAPPTAHLLLKHVQHLAVTFPS